MRQDIFLKKLLLCRAFWCSSKRSKLKRGFPRLSAECIGARRSIFFELIDYINATEDTFDEQAFQLVVNIAEEIICTDRPAQLVPNNQLSLSYLKDKSDIPISLDALEEETLMEDSEWSAIQLAYELFIQMITVERLDTRSCLKYLTESFISKLFHLLRIGDIRERDYLKTIIHRIYQRVIRRRTFLRKKINEYLFTYMFEGEPCYGIREVLELLSSIVHGFAVPLKEEHKDMFFRYLMPLHRKAELEIFFPPLLSCVIAFAQKDPTLIPSILSRLCSTWPKCDSMKQVLYINEVEIVLQSATESVFSNISRLFWLQLSSCTCCPHFQVAERVLCLLDDARLVKMLAECNKELLITLVESLDKAIEQHWCKSVSSIALKVKQHWIQAVPEFFQCQNTYDRGGTVETVYPKQKRNTVSTVFMGNYTSVATATSVSKQSLLACTEYHTEFI